jgi:pimeloyl-ACP methyl ester carboxylesterase
MRTNLFRVFWAGLILTTALIAKANPQVTTQSLVVGGGRTVLADTYFKADGLPWIVYVPGSGEHLNPRNDIMSLQILTNAKDFNLLVINKVAVGEDGKAKDADAFQRGSLRGQRIADNIDVMKRLVPQNSSILLVALSEGAYIAPDISEQDPRVKAMILLSGNSWSWLEEEVRYLPEDQQQAKRDFLVHEVIPNPVFDKFYSDWAYAYFDSYVTDATYLALQRSTMPILAVNAEKDDVLWLQGAIDNMRRLIDTEGKQNIEFHMIQGADHTFKCPEDDKACDINQINIDLKTVCEAFLKKISATL